MSEGSRETLCLTHILFAIPKPSTPALHEFNAAALIIGGEASVATARVRLEQNPAMTRQSVPAQTATAGAS